MIIETANVPRLVDVYAYFLEAGTPKYLLLRRSRQVIYAGQWRMVGGKVKNGETSAQAALREFAEETDTRPVEAWVAPTVNAFYDLPTDQIRYIPAFAFQCATQDLRLNHEHDTYGWFELEEAVHRLAWYEQKRILTVIHSIITSNSIQPEWRLSV